MDLVRVYNDRGVGEIRFENMAFPIGPETQGRGLVHGFPCGTVYCAYRLSQRRL